MTIKYLWLLVLLFAFHQTAYCKELNDKKALPKPVLVSGTISYQSKPEAFSFGQLAFFSDKHLFSSNQSSTIQLPLATANMTSSGGFSVEITPGSYVLGVFSSSIFPPVDGETRFWLSVNDDGSPRIIKISAKNLNDLGTIVVGPYDTSKSIADSFSVAGKIFSQPKTKLSDSIVVVAKKDFNSIRPLYISRPVGERGEYTMKLSAGSYILIARELKSIGGRPEIGELFGVYGAQKHITISSDFLKHELSEKYSVRGDVGEALTGLDIELFPVPDPDKLKEELKNM